MQTTGPFTPVAGQLAYYPDPSTNQPQAVSVQIQNSSAFSLSVVAGGDDYSVAAYTATTVPTKKAGSIIITPQPGEIVGGAMTLVWMQPGDSPPISDGPLAGAASSYFNQIFLGTGAKTAGQTTTVSLDASWRGLWIVTKAGTVPTVVGAQSGITYANFTPPYVNTPAKFYRFPMISGLDTSVTITWPTDTVWWGADLAPIDTTTFTVTGSP